MIDISTARTLVEKELSQKSLNQAPEDQLVIVDILSIEEIGWIFLYSTKALSATRYVDDELIANSSIIVDKKYGSLRYISPTRLTEDDMEEFRQKKLAFLLPV